MEIPSEGMHDNCVTTPYASSSEDCSEDGGTAEIVTIPLKRSNEYLIRFKDNILDVVLIKPSLNATQGVGRLLSKKSHLIYRGGLSHYSSDEIFMNGFGALSKEDGTVIMCGYFQDGVFQGLGWYQRISICHTILMGHFVNGHLEGQGTMQQYEDPAFSYTGHFEESQPSGNGSWTFHETVNYFGGVINLKADGTGTYHPNKGDFYVEGKFLGTTLLHGKVFPQYGPSFLFDSAHKNINNKCWAVSLFDFERCSCPERIYLKNRKKKTVTEPTAITELDKLNAEKHAQELLVQLEKEAKKEIEEEAKKQRQMGSKKNTPKNTEHKTKKKHAKETCAAALLLDDKLVITSNKAVETQKLKSHDENTLNVLVDTLPINLSFLDDAQSTYHNRVDNADLWHQTWRMPMRTLNLRCFELDGLEEGVAKDIPYVLPPKGLTYDLLCIAVDGGRE